jgi:prepilin-type N-terminal cleavage/methylation domain-containing protein
MARKRSGAPRRERRSAFTLVELLVVMGLIAMLMSLLFPVAGKMRAAANSTACLSNLRQMGMAWSMYTSDSRGKLMPFVWTSPTNPDLAWNTYWLGVVEQRNVKGAALLCSAATDVSESAPNRGYGNASLAWNGKFAPLSSAVRFNATTFRQSSYGFNRGLTARGGYGYDGQ